MNFELPRTERGIGPLENQPVGLLAATTAVRNESTQAVHFRHWLFLPFTNLEGSTHRNARVLMDLTKGDILETLVLAISDNHRIEGEGNFVFVLALKYSY